MDQPPSSSASPKQGQDGPSLRDLATPLPCPACRNLEYGLYDVCDVDGKDGTHKRVERHHVTQFPDVKASAEAGCWTCHVVWSAARIFWGETPEERLHVFDKEISLYLVREPGQCLGIMRIPRSHVHTDSGVYFSGDYDYPRLDVFTELGTLPAHPAFGVGATVLSQLTLPEAVQRVRRWLGPCRDAHPSCGDGSPTRLPSRVLDVGGMGGRSTRLVETGGGMSGEYMTLSHCWGPDEATWPTRTTMANLEARKRDIPSEELSTLFRDVISLARGLGCRFVWIDSLCIIQDSPEDWTRESRRMAHVYSAALLNVAATSMPNSHCSLFKDRVSPATMYEPEELERLLRVHTLSDLPYATTVGMARVRRSHHRTHVLVKGVAHMQPPDQEHLLGRAWVLQERLLAPRTIHFCCSEMVWECSQSYACECMGINRDGNDSNSDDATTHAHPHLATVPDRPVPVHAREGDVAVAGWRAPTLKHRFWKVQQGTETRQAVHDTWLRVVEEYSALCLSKPEDRYAAVAGIAEVFGHVLDDGGGDRYLAGIWEKDLPRSLAWSGIGFNGHVLDRFPLAPSWSWMSVTRKEGSCHAFYTLRLHPDEHLTVRHHHRPQPQPLPHPYASSQDGSHYGSSHDGALEITAWTIRGTLLLRYSDYDADDDNDDDDNDMSSRKYPYTSYIVRPSHSEQEFHLIADRPGCDADGLRDQEDLLCLLLGRHERGGWKVLVLRNLPGDEEMLYSRVGSFYLLDVIHFKQEAELRTITLV